MSILILDFEATDKDPKTARVTEIGAQLVSDDLLTVLGEYNSLVWDSSYPTLTPEVINITGITQEMLTNEGLTPEEAFSGLGKLINKEPPQYVIAYNRMYDEVLFREEMIRNLLTLNPKMSWLLSTPWICAMADVEANHKLKAWKLMYVALEHGVAVDPKELHRAINDVELTRKMLIGAKATPDAMYEYQTSPWVYAVALTKAPWEDNGKSTGAAKELGFGWQQAKGDDTGRVFEKRWVKRLKQKDWEALQEAATFQVRLLP